MPRIGKHQRDQKARPDAAAPGPSAQDPSQPSTWPAIKPLMGFSSSSRFPVAEVFPKQLLWMQDYLAAVAESYQVPIDLPAMLALPIMSASIAGAFEIHLGGDWHEPSALWTLTKLESGERKSAVLSEMMRPIKSWERKAGMDTGGERTRAKVRLASTKAQIDKLLKKIESGASEAGDTAQEDENRIVALEQEAEQLEAGLVTPRLFTDEATTEALARLLSSNGGRALVAASEGDVIDIMLGHYSRKPNLGVWLKGQAGETITIDRKDSTIIIPRPCLSMAITVQSQVVANLYASETARDRGYLARILPCCPPSMMGRRKLNPDPVPTDLREKFAETIEPMLSEKAIAIDGAPAPNMIGLTRAAKGAFDQFRAENERRLIEGGRLTYDTGWGNKLPGQVARIALTLHCLHQFAAGFSGVRMSPAIPEEIMLAAIAAAEYLMEQNELVNKQTVVSGDELKAQRVLSWARREGKPRFTRRELVTANRDRGNYQLTESFDPVVDLLIEHAIIRPITGEDDGKPGRKSEWFELSPYALRPAPGTEDFDPLPDDPNGRSDDQ